MVTINLGLSNERAYNVKLALFIYNVEKISAVHIHLPNRHLWHNLLYAVE